jgi:hypothetical protein
MRARSTVHCSGKADIGLVDDELRQPPSERAAPQMRRWRIAMSDGQTRTIEAHSCRVEAGALVLVLPVGAAAAYAPGTWAAITAFGATIEDGGE